MYSVLIFIEISALMFQTLHKTFVAKKLHLSGPLVRNFGDSLILWGTVLNCFDGSGPFLFLSLKN